MSKNSAAFESLNTFVEHKHKTSNTKLQQTPSGPLLSHHVTMELGKILFYKQSPTASPYE